MTEPVVDTDIIVRFITGDDPVKEAAATALFERVERGELIISAPVTVIADAVFVLGSTRIYGRSRSAIRDMLLRILRLPGFRVDDRQLLIEALDIYAVSNSGFGDAMIVAYMRRQRASTLYSYDRGFDRYANLQRVEP